MATGTPEYRVAAAGTVRSVLERTDWDVVLHSDAPVTADLRDSPRVAVRRVDGSGSSERAAPFLAKFEALRDTLATSDTELIALLDADTRVVADVSAIEVAGALGGRSLGMVEQTGIRGSDMNRARFLEHYRDYSLRFIAPTAPVPAVDAFRFFNSGVLFGQRAAVAAAVDWALDAIARTPGPHTVGEHMIADQDYLQVWTNTLHPDVCADLDWSWNHCGWWDDPFPREGARIVHFSNFTRGPTVDLLAAMDQVEAHYRGERAPEVSAVVVTYRSAGVLADCLRALRLAGAGEVVVVDNGSDDGSADLAERHGATVLRLLANHGFAAAANAGLRAARGAIAAVVNPDLVLDGETLAAGVALCRDDPRVIAAPDLVEPDGAIVAGARGGYTRRRLAADLGGARYERLLARTPAYDGARWRWAHGACLIANRERLLALGGFDEGYPLYMEDVDLGRRWCAAGGRVVSTGTRVAHVGGGGSDIDPAERARLLREARLLYGRRAYGPLTGWALERVARVAA